MSELAKLIAEQLEKLETNPFDAAKKGGFERSFINDILIAKKATVRGDNLNKLALALDLPVARLVEAQSRKTRGAYQPEPDFSPDRPVDVSPELFPDRRKSADTILEVDVGLGAGGGGARIEAWAHDGNGNTYQVEGIRGEWSLPQDIMQGELRAPAKSIRAFEVKGDSMQPILYDHDRAFIDLRATYPHPEGIFALFDGYGLVVKRIQIIVGSDPLRIRIISANPAYDPYERLFEEVKIIGRLAGRFTATFPT